MAATRRWTRLANLPHDLPGHMIVQAELWHDLSSNSKPIPVRTRTLADASLIPPNSRNPISDADRQAILNGEVIARQFLLGPLPDNMGDDTVQALIDASWERVRVRVEEATKE